jgi:hypothetical protein
MKKRTNKITEDKVIDSLKFQVGDEYTWFTGKRKKAK